MLLAFLAMCLPSRSLHLRAVLLGLHGAGPSPHPVAVLTAFAGNEQTQE